MPAACRSCRAPVTWAITDLGNRIPLDLTPVADGNIVVIGHQAGTTVVRVVTIDEPAPAGAPRYVSHFATCPNADAHRRGR